MIRHQPNAPRSPAGIQPTLALALLAAAGFAVPAARADLTTYRWWNPGSAPVSGTMAESANWENFVRPSTAAGAQNHLSFDFANPINFTAQNNWKDGLSVSYISHESGSNSCWITGLPLELSTWQGPLGTTKPGIDSRTSGDMTIETPLGGTNGLVIEAGQVVLAPNNRTRHTLSGGIEIRRGSSLTVSAAWHTGSLSNTLTVNDNGYFHLTQPMTIAIPVTVDGGVIYTDTTGTVTFRELMSNDLIYKRGPGTLRIERDSYAASDDWRILQGTLETSANASSASWVTVAPGATLKCGANTSVSLCYADGMVDLGGYQLTVANGFVTDLTGAGVLTNQSQMVNIEGDLSTFTGEIRANTGGFVVGINVDLGADTLLNAADGDIAVWDSHSVGGIAGSHSILPTNAPSFTIGLDNQTREFSGTLRSVNHFHTTLIKAGTGTSNLSGTIDVSGEVHVQEGTLVVNASSIDPDSQITVFADGTLAISGTLPVVVPKLVGSGAVQVYDNARLRIGMVGGSYTFGGTIKSGYLGELEKRGTTETRLTGDTSEYLGFVSVFEGSLRFSGQDIFPSAGNVLVTGTGELRGYGRLAAPLLSYTVIKSDVAGQTLQMTGIGHQSAGLIQAVGGGIVELESVDLNQYVNAGAPEGTTQALGGTVRCTGADPVVVSNGRIETDAAGQFSVQNTSTTLSDLDLVGNVSIDPGASALLQAVNLRIDPGDTLTVHFDPASPQAPIRGHGSATLHGTLGATLPAGYTPTEGDRIAVIAGEGGVWAVDSAFEGFWMPDVSPFVLRVDTRPDALDLVVRQLADFAPPFGVITPADAAAFLDAYRSGDMMADLAAPFGQLDAVDVQVFFEAYRGSLTPSALSAK